MSQIDIALHPKQTVAYLSPATEILYGGAAGGGKSHLMRCQALTMAMEIPGIQIYIFRRLSGDLVKNHIEGPSGFNAMLMGMYESRHAKYNESKNTITFWNGSKIFLCHCQHEKDRFKYQGAEMHILMIDELTHFTEKIYRFLRSRVRVAGLEIPDKWKHKIPFIFNGSNPGNVGHSWVKTTFVTSAPYGECHRTAKDEGGMLRQYIPALLSDNPNLGEDYADQLRGMGSPEQVKAMLNGDWDIVMGGAMDDKWSREKQVIPRFWIPDNWYVDRSFDWGSTHPFSVGWWAVSNGEEVQTIDRKQTLQLPANSLIRFHEWYTNGMERRC